MNKIKRVRPAELEAMQARFAFRVTATLSASELPHDIGERLRVARERAVATARQVRAARPVAAAASVILANGRATATFGHTPLWLRLASVAPLIVLVGGLVLIQQWHDRQQVHAAAEVDAALLADDLPPAAYTDPGFVEFLKMPEP